MKNKIDNENYAEVMLGLLEGEYSGDEKEDILFEIERDPLLQFEWKQFQKCVFKAEIKPYEIEEVTFWKSLHKKEKEPIRKMYIWDYVFAIAVSILLLITFTYLYLIPQHETPIGHQGIVQSTPQTDIIEKSIPKDLSAHTESGLPELIRPAKLQAFITADTMHNNGEKITDHQIDSTLFQPEISTKSHPQITALVKNQKYSVRSTSEDIDASDFALMQEYDISNIQGDEKNRINAFLKNKHTDLAQLLKNTNLKIKKKDNKIYLMAYGDDNSMFLWEIANQ